MKRYARIEDGKVAEIVTLEDGFAIAECFPAELQFVEAEDDAEVGWSFDGTSFEAPEPAPPVEPLPVTSVHGAYLRAALAEAGDLDRVYEAHASDPIKLELFRGATSFSRGEPDLETGAAALGINLDARFARADEIRRNRGG